MVYRQKVVLLKAATVIAVLCNEGDVSMEEFQWICYNYILGLPLETTHRWAEPNGSTFSMPEAIQGDYLAKEGIPAHCTVWQENGKLVGIYGETEVEFRYCGKTVFAAYSRKDPAKRCSTMEFIFAMDRHGRYGAIRESIRGLTGSAKLLPAES